jgi:antitoxin HigA-1
MSEGTLEMTLRRDELEREIGNEPRVYAPIHPGRVLELEWLEPLGITAYELAKTIHVPKQRMYDIVRGKRGITTDTALRLARWSGMRPSFWVGLQSHYDLELAKWRDGERIAGEIQPLAPA